MKKCKRIIVLILIPPLIVFLNSCEKVHEFNNNTIDKPIIIDPVFPDKEDVAIKYNLVVNKWIMSVMKKYYLWSSIMPLYANDSIIPIGYFKSLLFNFEQAGGDRFSQIIDLRESIGASSLTACSGYDYVLLGISFSQNIYGYVNYVVKGSPAESAGLKRGDLFLKVNGTQLTRSNHVRLINQTTKCHTLTKAILSENGSLVPISDITIGVDYFNESPVFLDSIYNIDGKKVGYIIYNSFTPDKGDGTYNYDRYLNSIFGKFKREGVKELILDLRYNGGGALTSAVHLASMIVGQSKVGQVFVKRIYNENLQKTLLNEYGEEYFIDRFKRDINGEPINHLDINKIYILVSHRTSSASELVINGLKPYLNVVLIGKYSTVGKNVVSMPFKSQDKKASDWELLPVVAYMSNSVGNSNYSNGFVPDIRQEEYDIENPKPLGNIEELLLARALYEIGGRISTKSGINTYNSIYLDLVASSEMVLYPRKQNMYIDQINVTY